MASFAANGQLYISVSRDEPSARLITAGTAPSDYPVLQLALTKRKNEKTCEAQEASTEIQLTHFDFHSSLDVSKVFLVVLQTKLLIKVSYLKVGGHDSS